MLKNHKTLLSFILIVFIYATIVSTGLCEPKPVIIAAISISSWFLTIADFCISQTLALQDEVIDQLSATNDAAKKIISIGRYVIERKMQLTLNNPENVEIKKYLDLETELKYQERQIARKNRQLQNAIKGNKINIKLGNGLKISGYAVLILTVLFSRCINANNINLDALTVWAFFIMLVGYLFSSMMVNQKKRQAKESSEALSALEAMEAKLEVRKILQQQLLRAEADQQP